tara:strand:+ start:6275 stop:6487 length:213 start_codon:yes stop_codon:yes gene_type:complete
MYHFGDSWAAEAVALRMKTIRNRQGDADTVPHSAWKLQLFHYNLNKEKVSVYPVSVYKSTRKYQFTIQNT